MTRAPADARVTPVELSSDQVADLRERIQKKTTAARTRSTTTAAMILLVVIAAVIRYMRRTPPMNGLQTRTGWPGT